MSVIKYELVDNFNKKFNDEEINTQCHKLKDHETRTFNIGLMNHDHCTSFFYEIYNFSIFLLFLKQNSYVFFKKLKHVFMNFDINRP